MISSCFPTKALDSMPLLVAALLSVTLFPAPAYAYVDPSVMTYTIQALAGVAVALSAVLGVALRRTRRVILRALHIDENARRQVEPSAHRVDASSEDAAYMLARADEEALASRQSSLGATRAKHLSWLQRFVRGLVASLFLVGTVFVVAPLEVVSGSSSSLVFDAGDVAGLVIIAALILSICLAFLLSIPKGHAFDVLVTVVVAVGLCCYVQAMFLNRSLPIADGQALSLASYKTITTFSTCAWLAIIVGLLILNRRKTNLWRTGSMLVCVCLIMVQGAGVVSLVSAQPENDGDLVVTKEGLFEVGSEANIVVFVLDTFDTQQLNHLLAQEPKLLDEFTGFTYFEDSVGSMVPTRYGIPFLLTGRMPEGGDGYPDFVTSWYDDSTLLPDIKKAGYSVGVYSDSFQVSYLSELGVEGLSFMAQQADNIHEADRLPLDPIGALAILDKVALYRDMPWLLKPLFWFYTDDVNNGVVSKGAVDAVPYTIDDVGYSDELFERGLTVGTDGKAFRFIHLNGAHPPYVLADDGHEAGEGSDLDQASRGALAVVEEYIRELKELGLYDGASIIITADHGEWYITPDELSGPTSPILLVKPAESAEGAAAPLKVSSVPTGHLDYAATLIAAAGGDSEAYGPTVFEVGNAPRVRRYWMTTSNGYDDQELKEMIIDGPVLDWNSWRFTGNEMLVEKAVLAALAAEEG